jgi:hypothetical protein
MFSIYHQKKSGYRLNIMATYAIYTRTKEGAISRAADVFNWEGPLGPYMHEEPLAGWPESKVFWIYKTGYSIGLAPMFASSHSSQS